LPLISICLLSAGALAYELLLMRLLSIIQWHHFAYMIISLALLGYGANGSLIAIFRKYLLKRFTALYPLAIVMFGLSSVVCFLLAQSLPFNAEELLWDKTQPLWLLTLYLLLAVPFFFAASAIALAFSRFGANIGRLYAFDLLGAGLGSLMLIGLLFYFLPFDILVILELIALLAALIAGFELKSKNLKTLSITFIAGIVIAYFTLGSSLKISEYKSLNKTLLINGTEIIDQHSSPLGLLNVVKSNIIPLRHAPGLSLNASAEPPLQLGVFTDASNMTVINQDKGVIKDFAYLDFLSSALPYHLNNPQNVLILGAGGGAGVSQALYHKANRVTAVEINPQLANLVQNDYGEFAGNLYQNPKVKLVIDEARGFVSGSKQKFDLIQVALLDAFAASASGLYALNESYLYTLEALNTYLKRVKPAGYLAISRWIKLPPRDTLKLFATAVSTLRQSGIKNPGKHLLLIRSWQTSTLLIKPDEFTKDEINAAKQFCHKRSFDLAWYPGMQKTDANQYNRLHEPYFYQAAMALLNPGLAENYFDNYKFEIKPATDDKPYFFHFFKWKTLPEILKLKAKASLPLLEWGYLVLIATLLQAVLVSLILIILPLKALKPENNHKAKISTAKVFIYFMRLLHNT